MLTFAVHANASCSTDHSSSQEGSAPWLTASLRWTAFIFALCIYLLLTACGASAVPEAQASIGAAGGTLNGPDGVRIEVPPGALTKDTVIRVAKTSAGAPGTMPEGVTPAAMYELTPHGIDFNLPVTISMPNPTGSAAQRQVFMASPGDSAWRSVDSVSDASRTTWQVMGFSWVMMSGGCRPAAGDASPCQWPSSNGYLSATPSNALTFVNQDLSFSIKSYRLTSAGTVDLHFNYSGAADCGGTVRVTRWQPSVRDANDRIIVTELLPGQSQVLNAIANNPGRGQNQIQPLPITFTSSDNGEHVFGMSFTCARPRWNGGTMSVGGQLRLTVDIPVSSAATAPAVNTQPSPVSVIEPATATFMVAVSGTPKPAVQWQRLNNGSTTWADIPGATSLSYTTPATTVASDNGSQYRAILTNSQGSVNSQAATLSVSAPPAPVLAPTASVIAGAIGVQGQVDAPSGPGTDARLNNPSWLARDAAGNIYISSQRDIRKISPQGAVTTFASGVANTNLRGLAVGSDGKVYAAADDVIKVITPQGTVSVLSGLIEYDRPQTATFSQPHGLAISGVYLYVADYSNYAIRRIDLTNGEVYTVVKGSSSTERPNDGCSGATLTRPIGIAADSAGSIWWTEENHTIRSKGECIFTLAGFHDEPGHDDGVGSSALFHSPYQLTYDGRSNLYVADFQGSVLRRIELRGAFRTASSVSTVFGVYQDATTVAGPGGRIAYPLGVLSMDSRTLIATSSSSHVVLKVALPD